MERLLQVLEKRGKPLILRNLLKPGGRWRKTAMRRATLGQDVGRARVMLSRFLGDVVLHPEKDGLWAEVRGNFGVLLDGNDTSVGAGRGILHLPTWRLVRRAVA